MSTCNFSQLVPLDRAPPPSRPPDEVIPRSALEVQDQGFDAGVEFGKLREDICIGLTDIRRLLEEIQHKQTQRAGDSAADLASDNRCKNGQEDHPKPSAKKDALDERESHQMAPRGKHTTISTNVCRISATSNASESGIGKTTSITRKNTRFSDELLMKTQIKHVTNGALSLTLGSEEEQVRTSAEKKIERAKKTTFQTLAPDINTLDQEEYDVTLYYHREGFSQIIARSEVFASLTFGVIMVNTIYIGIDVDWNSSADPVKQASPPIPYLVCDNLFCVFFVFELFVRFFSFRNKLNCLQDTWFKFDCALVILMSWETWVMVVLVKLGIFGTSTSTGWVGMIKILRLLRLARMARFMRAVPEIVAMIKGLRAAMRTVASAILMLVLVLYFFSIVLFIQLRTEDPVTSLVGSKFGTLRDTMWTLLCDGVFLESFGKLTLAMLEAGKYLEVVVLTVFVLTANLTVLNMLIGMLCEVVSATTRAEIESHAVKLMKQNILVLLKDLDGDGTGAISREEMTQVLTDPDALNVLAALGVYGPSLLENLDWHFTEKGEVAISEVMNLILMMRGDCPVTVRDLTHAQSLTRWKIDALNANVTALHESLECLHSQMVSSR